MKRLLAFVAATALAGCATTDASKSGSTKKEPTLEKMAVTNVIPFDVAACGPRVTLELSPLTPEVLTGALLSLAPAFQECFLDPKAVEGEVQATLKATVGAEVAFEVAGTGVSASGKACLVAAAKQLALKPLEASAKPVAAEVPVAPAFKAVAMGVNQASDLVGTVRSAQMTFCPCYAELAPTPSDPAGKAAPTLVGKFSVSKEKDKPAQSAGLEPNDAPSISECVTQKLAALKLPAVEAKVPFLLKNSYASEPSPGAQAALQFQQYDGIRAQRTADVLVAAGRRGVDAAAYDAVVAKYKAKPAPTLIAELRSKCAAVVKSDDAWIGSLKTLVGVFQASLKLAQTEKANDAGWAPVEQALSQQLDGATTEQLRVEGQKKADENACPKNK
jgi:hypothetical protein